MNLKEIDIKSSGFLTLIYIAIVLLLLLFFSGSGSLFGIFLILLAGFFVMKYGGEYVRELLEKSNRLP